jgi:hypothetical protein
MTSSAPSAAKLPTVKLELGPMVVFDGAPEKFPWFWKKFRAYCMKKPEVWAVLSKQKGRRTQLSFHAEATGDTKRFFPIFAERNANTTLTDTKYDAANQFIYSLWMDVLTEAAADLLAGVEEGDGMSITATALARYQRDDLPAKMKVSFNLLSMKQAASETLETYTARNMQSMSPEGQGSQDHSQGLAHGSLPPRTLPPVPHPQGFPHPTGQCHHGPRRVEALRFQEFSRGSKVSSNSSRLPHRENRHHRGARYGDQAQEVHLLRLQQPCRIGVPQEDLRNVGVEEKSRIISVPSQSSDTICQLSCGQRLQGPCCIPPDQR